jgi:hypothetical protein
VKKRNDLARCYGQDLMRGEHKLKKRTTWVAGNRPIEKLDETSRKNLAAGGQGQEISGTSIFDPVLCELVYRWFCPLAGVVLDPFAGGSVRGIVAAKLGRKYIGIELRREQIEANRQQAAQICDDVQPCWIEGDSQSIKSLASDVVADLIFSCPPYYDLEVYSEDQRDLSTMDYAAFCSAYRSIIAGAIDRLRDDRFACFVVSDVRDKKGYYRNFVGETVAAFEAAGAKLYNEAILVTAVGSLPIMITKQFTGGRKLGKTHQNVLVFCKGDWRKATETVGPVEFGELPEPLAIDEAGGAGPVGELTPLI